MFTPRFSGWCSDRVDAAVYGMEEADAFTSPVIRGVTRYNDKAQTYTFNSLYFVITERCHAGLGDID